MELEGEHAIEQSALGVLVGAIKNQAAVKVMLDVVAFGDDDHVVPVIDFEELLVACEVKQAVNSTNETDRGGGWVKVSSTHFVTHKRVPSRGTPDFVAKETRFSTAATSHVEVNDCV